MQDTKLISKIRFPARPYQLKQVRFIVHNAMRNTELPPIDVDRVVLAVNEACMNIIQHAYGHQNTGEIILEIFDQTDRLVFRLTDFAKKIDKTSIKSRDLTDIRPGGLGVHLMQEVMDQVKYLDCPGDCGNIVELVKKLHRREGA